MDTPAPATHRLRRALHPLLVLAFLFASTLTLLAGPGLAPAYASGNSLIDVNPGADDSSGGPGYQKPDGSTPRDPGDPDSGGDPGGSGGSLPAGWWAMSGSGFWPNQPPSYIGGRAPADSGYTTYSRVWSYNGQCNGNFTWSTRNGSFSAKYLGWTWQTAGSWEYGVVDANDRIDDATDLPTLRNAVTGGYDCIEPPRYTEWQVKCATRADATLVGPSNSPLFAERTRTLPQKTTAFERGGRQDPDLCDRSWTFNFGRSPAKWGQYEMVGTAYYVTCTITDYYTEDRKTGRVPADTIACNDDELPAGTDRARLELFCNPPYYHQNVWHDDHSFTAADCDEGVQWDCGPQIAQRPRLAGRRSPVDILDDGKARLATWASPAPTGDLRRVRNRQARLRYREGSPFRAQETRNGDTQPFAVNPKNDAGWTRGWRLESANPNRTGWDLAFFAPGDAGDPWQARPQWKFTADFKAYEPTIIWNMATNRLDVSLSPVWLTADAVCTGEPIEVNVHRARNTSQ